MPIFKWKQQNIRKGKVPNHPGLYIFRDGHKNPLYVGVTKNGLRHRLQSYYQDDDYHAHPTKAQLRNKIRYVEWRVMSMAKARRLEHRIKPKTAFNYK